MSKKVYISSGSSSKSFCSVMLFARAEHARSMASMTRYCLPACFTR